MFGDHPAANAAAVWAILELIAARSGAEISPTTGTNDNTTDSNACSQGTAF
jgi:ribosomal protein S12 methylthiotransferase accessory factor YcaO